MPKAQIQVGAPGNRDSVQRVEIPPHYQHEAPAESVRVYGSELNGRIVGYYKLRADTRRADEVVYDYVGVGVETPSGAHAGS